MKIRILLISLFVIAAFCIVVTSAVPEGSGTETYYKWSQATGTPTGLGTIYQFAETTHVVGGEDYLYVYDWVNNAIKRSRNGTYWESTATSVFSNRYLGGSLLSYGGCLYHLGGRDADDGGMLPMTSKVYKSCDDGTTWSASTALPAAVAYAGGVVYDNYMYLFFGKGSELSNSQRNSYIFGDGTSWTQVNVASTYGDWYVDACANDEYVLITAGYWHGNINWYHHGTLTSGGHWGGYGYTCDYYEEEFWVMGGTTGSGGTNAMWNSSGSTSFVNRGMYTVGGTPVYNALHQSSVATLDDGNISIWMIGGEGAGTSAVDDIYRTIGVGAASGESSSTIPLINGFTYNATNVSYMGGVGVNMTQSGYSHLNTSIDLIPNSACGGNTKYQPITYSVAESSTYQSRITISHDADMQVDFDDLRFYTGLDCTTSIPYWIESKVDDTSAIVWLRGASDTSVIMTYGNASLTTGSSMNNTFTWSDDFTDSSLNTTLWASAGAYTENTSALTVCTSCVINTTTSYKFGGSTEMRMRMWVPATNNGYFHGYGKYAVESNNAGFVYYSGTLTYTRVSGVGKNEVSPYLTGQYETFTIDRFAANTTYWANTTKLNTNATTIATPNRAGFDGNGVGVTYVDWVLFRNITDTQPILTLGSEIDVPPAGYTVPDNYGYYELSNFLVGYNIYVNATKSMYTFLPYAWGPWEAENVTMNLYLLPDAGNMSEFTGGQGIYGLSYFNPLHNPADGIEVMIWNTTWTDTNTTNGAGFYVFPDLKAGTYYVNASFINATSDTYTVVVTAANNTMQYIPLDPFWKFDVTVRDLVSLAPLPGSMVEISAYGDPSNVTLYNQLTNASGVAEWYMHWGDYVALAWHAGYVGTADHVYLIENKSIILYLVTSNDVAGSGYGASYGTHTVKFQIISRLGKDVTGVTITATPTQSSNPWEWFWSLFGINSTAVDINSTQLVGTTGSDGAIGLLMMPTIQYNINAFKGGVINQNVSLYPTDDVYVIYADSTWDWFSSGDIEDVNVSTDFVAGSSAYFAQTYFCDSSGGTSNVWTTVFKYTNNTPAQLYTQTNLTAPCGQIMNYTLTSYSGFTYGVFVNVSSSEFGNFNLTKFISFPPSIPPTQETIFGIPSELTVYVAFAIMVFTGMMFTRSNLGAGALICAFEGWIFYLTGFIRSSNMGISDVAIGLLLTFATFAAVMYLMAYRKEAGPI